MPKEVQINGVAFKELPEETQKQWIKNTLPPGDTKILNDDQVLLCLYVCLGKNICLLGPPGVGKTAALNRAQYLMHILYPETKFDRTATTGMASTHLDNGKTLFDLLKTGTDSCLSYLPQFREKLMSPRVSKIIEELNSLHIDEASMLSEQAFNSLESAARVIRKNRKFMGGIQIILSGDIFQMPVVDGKVGAGHDRFKKIKLLSILENLPLSFEVVMLTQNIRSEGDIKHQAIIKALIQQDPSVRKRAIELLHDTCYETTLSIEDALRLSMETGKMILTPINESRELYNRVLGDILRKTNPSGPIEIGDAKPLHSWDTLPSWAQIDLINTKGLVQEEKSIIDQHRFESNLSLYPGEPVMLRKNTKEYKNGEKCVFTSLSPDSSYITVRRYSDGAVLNITKSDITSEFIHNIGFEAFPLIKDAAMSIHMSQGSTLDNGVILDPYSLFNAPRLMYVAISRARTLGKITLTEKIDIEKMVDAAAQKDIDRIWSLDYMANYPTITLEELNAAFS